MNAQITLSQFTKNQVERIRNAKQLAIEADKAILPSTTKKLAKQALITSFEIIEELINSNARLMQLNNLDV